MNLYEKLLKNESLRRFLVLGFIVLTLYLMRSFMSLMLLTFIFAFLSVKIVRIIQHKTGKNIRPIIIIIPIYIVLLGILYYGIVTLIPSLIHQTPQILDKMLTGIHQMGINQHFIETEGNKILDQLNIAQTLKSSIPTVYHYATKIGGMAVTFIVALVFSFLYTSEVDDLDRFNHNFLTSKFDWFFQDVYYFGKKFVNSFGVVLETQIIIAIINTIITTIALAVIKLPNLSSLAIIIFVLSLIPVAGVILSFIPLAAFGYINGGFKDVLIIFVVLVIVHFFEAYVLNPKIMSDRTKLPVFYTFVILIVADKIFGTWGLLVGVPIFSFILDILGVKEVNSPIKTIRQKIKK